MFERFRQVANAHHPTIPFDDLVLSAGFELAEVHHTLPTGSHLNGILVNNCSWHCPPALFSSIPRPLYCVRKNSQFPCLERELHLLPRDQVRPRVLALMGS